ncbi:MAG: methyltransferase domain-containing protein [Acidaminococcaceae bacterium]|nr:methyltransferase domain-containing protein [Acidaminococcaceae bacterium]
MLEAGIGEGTMLLPLLLYLPDNFFNNIYGFDISWSRVKYAQKFMQENNKGSVHLFVGDLFNIPLADNSIDLVYTCHAIELNGGKNLHYKSCIGSLINILF